MMGGLRESTPDTDNDQILGSLKVREPPTFRQVFDDPEGIALTLSMAST
jgi:hypothetical protein